MRIETNGQQIEVTPALRDYVETKLGAAGTPLRPAHRRPHASSPWTSTEHRAEATVNIAGRTLHADATAADMYAAIDLLADKLDRLLIKHKEKLIDHHRGESAARSATSPDPRPARCRFQSLLAADRIVLLVEAGRPRRRARRRRAPARRRLPRRHARPIADSLRQRERLGSTGDRPRRRDPARPHALPSTSARGAFLRLARSGGLRREPTANRSTWCSRWPCRSISRQQHLQLLSETRRTFRRRRASAPHCAPHRRRRCGVLLAPRSPCSGGAA